VSDEIWVSEAPLRSENSKVTFNSFVPVDETFDESYYFAKQSCQKNASGEKLTQENFPEHIYSNKTSKGRKQEFRDFFFARGYNVISKKAADVLRNFELGNCTLFPVKISKSDMVTPAGEGWFCLNYGNIKNTIVPATPIGMMPIPNVDKKDLFIIGGYLKDDQLSVLSSAADGPDIWVDPRMLSGFFVSGRLADAIKSAGLRNFFLSRCKLV